MSYTYGTAEYRSIDQAICESVERHSAPSITATREEIEELKRLADDYAEDSICLDCWGTDDDGGQWRITATPAPVKYTYSVEMSINEGEALITVDATDGGQEAGAMFVVDADGNIDLDTMSDGCESNPFDPDGDWPEPPASHVAEAQELAAATEGEAQ